MKLLTILFVCMIATLSFNIQAKTPDGEVPANEGVCDELTGATRGLYGLCVAFCEAQDCEMDFSLDDPFENCQASSSKILDNYNRKKTDADPEMPCVVQSSCPCWSNAELESLPYPGEGKSSRCDSTSRRDIWSVNNRDKTGAYVLTLPGRGSDPVYRCRFGDTCSDGECLNVTRDLEITEEEYIDCTAQVQSSGIDRGFPCWD
jgi:hypothetical protein